MKRSDEKSKQKADAYVLEINRLKRERDYLRAGVKRLQAKVATLPLTNDRISITPGMRVWRIEHPGTPGEEVEDVSRRGVHLKGESDFYVGSEICSTREAAEATKAARKGE